MYDWVVWRTPLLSRMTRLEYQSILQLLGKVNLPGTATVLHVACGAKAIAWNNFAGNIIHLDRSRRMLNWSRRDKPDDRYLAADSLALPFQNESIFAIVAVGLTEYLPRPELWLQECNRVLQPNGVLLFSISQPNFGNRIRKLWSHEIYFRTEKQFSNLCLRNGFKVEMVSELPIQVQFLVRKKQSV